MKSENLAQVTPNYGVGTIFLDFFYYVYLPEFGLKRMDPSI